MSSTALKSAIVAALNTKIGAAPAPFDADRALIAEAFAESIDPHFIHDSGASAGTILYGQGDGSWASRVLVAGSNISIVEESGNVTISAVQSFTGNVSTTGNITAAQLIAQSGVTVQSGNVTLQGGVFVSNRVDHGQVSTSIAVDLSTGRLHRVEGTSASLSVTLNNPVTGVEYIFEIVGNSATPITVTWPVTVINGPFTTVSQGQKNVYGMYYNGAKFIIKWTVLGISDTT